MDAHLDLAQRTALAAGAPATGSTARHLERCAACRAALDDARADEALFEELGRATRPDSEPTALLAPDSIPGYELLGELHRGGQGTVYLAQQLSANRRVALKVLARGPDASSRNRLRFEREVELACRLHHPHVVAVYQSGESAGHLWYSMEYVEGVPLDRHVATAQPDRAQRLRLFRSIVDAVAHAHRRGVIHRDLKPANVLVDEACEPHVVDFGLALAATRPSRERVTSSGEFLGTLAWASPEQVRGDPDMVDTRTDVHALGLLLYEMLTGQLPWRVTGTVSEVLERIAEQEAADPSKLSRDVDDDLRTLLLTALAKDPGDRYSSADALLRDVDHWLAHEPLEARARSTGYVLRKAVVRHRRPLASLAIAALVVLVGVTALVRERSRADRQRTHAALVRSVMKDIVGAGSAMGDGAARLAVLEDARQRFEDALGNAPDVEGALRLALGEAYAEQLRDREAEEHLRHALARLRVAGDAAGEVRALERLARVLCNRGDPEAVTLAEEALVLRGADQTRDDPFVASGQRLLARTLIERLPEHREDRARAVELLDSALATLRRSRGDDDPEAAATQVLRASLQDTAEAALPLYANALAVLERHPGEAPRTIECLEGYASVLARVGHVAEAEEALARLVVLTRQTYGEEHTVGVLRRRAHLLFEKRELAAAERLARIALATELEAWSRRGESSAEKLSSLAAELRTSPGPAPYPEAFALLRELRGSGDFGLSSWMNSIAEIVSARGRFDDAEALLREALRIHCRVYGADCPNRRMTLYRLAQALAAQERRAEAIAHLRECVASFERAGEPERDAAREVRALLAELRGDGEWAD